MSWTNENHYGKTTWYFYPVLCFLSSGLSLLHHFTSLLHILVQFATGVLQLYGVMAFSNIYHSTFELFNNFFETNTDKIITVEIVQTLCFSLKFQLFITCWWGQRDLFILDSVAERMAMVADSTSLSLKSMTTVISTTSVPCSHFLSTSVINIGKWSYLINLWMLGLSLWWVIFS